MRAQIALLEALIGTSLLLAACSQGKSQIAEGSTGGNAGSASVNGGGPSSGGSSAGTSNSGGASTQAGAPANGGSSGAGTSAGGSGVSTGGASVGSGGSNNTAGTSSNGGGSAAGGTSSSGGSASGGTSSSGLPRLTVNGSKLQDPNGKTIVLRGSSLIDIGSLYAYGGQSAAGISARIDKVAAAGVQGHVVRLPVYPEITYNGTAPTCSPLPYPVGTGPSASCMPKPSLSAADYVTKVLKPAVDYATSKNQYVIIDFHQIDNATTGASAADATTFWTDVAPKFASYPNVFYEPFNEPIDNKTTWSALKPVVQGWIDTIRASAPQNIIIVPSNSWDQKAGDAASDPPSGTNLMYTAHIYPSNWNQTFQSQVASAVGKVPVFITEWGYSPTDANSHTWGTNLETLVDGNGASWTAWVTDNAWSPSMFSDTALTQLTDFGTLAKSWLAATASSDWVQ